MIIRKTYTLNVVGLHFETNDTVTFVLKQPTLKKIKYNAGQYLTLIFRINGRRYIRPYSFSSAPGIDSTLNITVKRVYGGLVSNHMIDTIKIGDVIEVMEPMGDFVLQHLPGNVENKHIVLWGSGSGITPLISIIKWALHDDSYDHITLVYGNRSFETTIFIDQIKELEKQFPSKFSVWHFHTQAVIDNCNMQLIQGRIDPDLFLKKLINKKELKNTFHFICGPAGLKNSIKDALYKIGINNNNIFSEEFEVIRDPQLFEDIITQNVLLKTQENEVLSLEVTKGKSILEAGLDAMIDLAYSCQTGSCLLCKAKVIKGGIKTIGIEKLPDSLDEDECLLCCSFPLTNDVEIVVIN
jgi:ring-1,2-phenylacetyl-CoA epoxidase subunit PaaE